MSPVIMAGFMPAIFMAMENGNTVGGIRNGAYTGP